MYENPLTRLSDDQIEQAIDEALARNDAPFIGELVGEIVRRGQPVDL